MAHGQPDWSGTLDPGFSTQCYLKTVAAGGWGVPGGDSEPKNAQNQQTFDRSKSGKSELFQITRFRHKSSHNAHTSKHETSKFKLSLKFYHNKWISESSYGTIQIFFYLILVIVSLYRVIWIKFKDFFGFCLFKFFSCFSGVFLIVFLGTMQHF